MDLSWLAIAGMVAGALLVSAGVAYWFAGRIANWTPAP
jgi:hypothetical protein